jgi:hypothetical protein
MATKKTEQGNKKKVETNAVLVGRETAEHLLKANLQGGTPQGTRTVNHSSRRKHVRFCRGVAAVGQPEPRACSQLDVEINGAGSGFGWHFRRSPIPLDYR